MSGNKGRRAIVLGGGIAGLTAAIGLSEHFENVVLLERGAYGEQPTVRKHVTQGGHAHILLASGLLALQRIVPALCSALDDMGLAECDLTRDIRFCYDGRWLPRVSSGIPFRPCSRPILEHLLLQATEARPNIQVRTGVTTTGLLGSSTVRGARVVDESGNGEDLEADLTVIAMGRGSKAVEWIEALSGETVPIDVVDPGLTYTSCTFEPPSGASDDWALLVDVSRYPSQSTTCVIVRSSPTEWLASLASYGRAAVPKTVEEFIQRYERGSTDVLVERLRAAKPIGTLRSFTNTANRRRRFNAIRHWPERVVVVGDGVCTLNPRYGQGMTVGALGIATLLEQLEQHWVQHETLDGLGARFQRALDKTLTVPWQIALMEDQLWAAQHAGRQLDLLEKVVMRCTRRALQTVFTDMDTYQRFMRVAHLLEAPTHLASPQTMAKMVFPALRKVA